MGTIFRAAALLLALALSSAPQVASAQTGNIYGAIAYSNVNGAYGFSHNYGSRQAAQNRAMRECRGQGGRSCRVVVWFANQCGALASGRRNGWGAAHAPRRQQAVRAALNFCRQNDRDCHVRVNVCSMRR